MVVVAEATPAGGWTFVTAIGWTCVTVTGIGIVTFGIFEMVLLPRFAVISIVTGAVGIVILTTGIPAWALDVVVRAPRLPVISVT